MTAKDCTDTEHTGTYDQQWHSWIFGLTVRLYPDTPRIPDHREVEYVTCYKCLCLVMHSNFTSHWKTHHTEIGIITE